MNKRESELRLKNLLKSKESKEKRDSRNTELSKKELELSVKSNLSRLDSREKSKLKLKRWKLNSERLKSRNKWKLIES